MTETVFWGVQFGTTAAPVASDSVAIVSPFMRPSLQVSNLSDSVEPEQQAAEVCTSRIFPISGNGDMVSHLSHCLVCLITT